MRVIVETITDPGTTIKREYKCKGGKCDVTVSFIVQDDSRGTPPTSTVQDTVANAPTVPRVAASADTPLVIEVPRLTPSVSNTRIVESAEESQEDTPPEIPPISASNPVGNREGVTQTAIAPDHTPGATESVQETSQPVSRAGSGHALTEYVQGRRPGTEHKPAEAAPNDQQSISLSDIVHKAATDAEQIKSIHDRLGSSVDYLEGVMKLGEFISEVSLDWLEMSVDLLSFNFHSSIPP